MPEQNYNQLVLTQLQSLSQAMEAIRTDLQGVRQEIACLLYTSPSPRDQRGSRMPSSA